MRFRTHTFLAVTCLLLVLCFSVPLFGQTASSTPVPTSPNQPQPQSDTERIAILQAQLDLMRQYDQRLLDTVYWSLGSLGVVVLLVIGLGWYTNFRIYKREVDEIKKGVQSELEVFKRSLTSEMNDAARKAGEAAVKSALKDIQTLQYQMLKLEAERYEKSGYHANALLLHSRMIPLAKDILAELYVPEVLEEMLRVLKTDKVILNAHATAEILKSLQLVPTEYSVDARCHQSNNSLFEV